MLGRSKTVFADDMILYIENPKGSKKLLELIKPISKQGLKESGKEKCKNIFYSPLIH